MASTVRANSSLREKALIKALRFYAENKSWETNGEVPLDGGFPVIESSDVKKTGGKLARQTLSNLGMPLKEGKDG